MSEIGTLKWVDLASESEFREYNFNCMLGHFEKVSEKTLEELIAGQATTGEFEPYLEETFSFSLSNRVATSFFRDHRNMPATVRDFQLSKFYFFLQLCVWGAVGRKDPLFGPKSWPYTSLIKSQIETIATDDSLPDLTDFSFYSFQWDLRKALDARDKKSARRICERLFEYLRKSDEIVVPSDVPNVSDSSDVRSDREDMLVQYQKRNPEDRHPITTIARKAGVHPSTVHKWLRGEMKSTSPGSKKIYRAVKDLLNKKA